MRRQNSGSHYSLTEKKEKIMKRDEDSIRDLWDNIRYANTHIIGIPGEEKEK